MNKTSGELGMHSTAVIILETAVDRLRLLGNARGYWFSGVFNSHPLGDQSYAPYCTFFWSSGVVAPPRMEWPCRVVASSQTTRKTHTKARSTAISRIIGLFAAFMGAGNLFAADLSGFTNQQSVVGLKDALQQGAANAVAVLGRQDGFLSNPKVKIPLPKTLAKGEKLLRTIGMGEQADELITAMNRAAEQAVPEAKTLLINAVRQMSVQDVKGVLTGGEDAATRYFRSKTEPSLRAKFLPIVTTTVDKVDLARKYNAIAGRAATMGLMKNDDIKIEDYVAQKALDGLYLVMAEQEKAFRENPVKAGSTLARKIFDALRQ
jgi:hypothetical protein